MLKTETQAQGMLTDAEAEKIIMAAVETGEKTDDQMHSILEWAKETKLRMVFFQWIMKDVLVLDWKDEIVFHKTGKQP